MGVGNGRGERFRRAENFKRSDIRVNHVFGQNVGAARVGKDRRGRVLFVIDQRNDALGEYTIFYSGVNAFDRYASGAFVEDGHTLALGGTMFLSGDRLQVFADAVERCDPFGHVLQEGH